MIYKYTVQQPKHNWYLQTDKDSLVNVKKNYEKFGSTTSLLWPQFHAFTGCDTVSHFFNVSKQYCFNVLL